MSRTSGRDIIEPSDLPIAKTGDAIALLTTKYSKYTKEIRAFVCFEYFVVSLRCLMCGIEQIDKGRVSLA